MVVNYLSRNHKLTSTLQRVRFMGHSTFYAMDEFLTGRVIFVEVKNTLKRSTKSVKLPWEISYWMFIVFMTNSFL